MKKATKPVSSGVVADALRLHEVVDTFLEDDESVDWSLEQKRLAAGVLAVYRLRLVDIDQGEYTLLLHLILGDHMLRSHAGASYTYESSLGFWSPYNGLPSQSSLKYIKKYLLRL